MTPTNMLTDFGRPVAYYPGLVKHMGSVNAVLFFCQIFYWKDKASEDLGVYKTAEEIEEETGLTYREQATARKLLVGRGILIETNRRLEHRIYYRIDEDRLNEVMSSANCETRNSPNDESAIRERTKAQFGNEQKRSSICTEITTEITTEPPLPPDGGEQSADAELPCPAGKSNSKQTTKQPAIQYQEFADAYNEILGGKLPRCEALSDKRKRAIKALAGNLRSDRPVIESFRDFLDDFLDHASGFYFGENDRGWRANFDYLIQVDTLIKAREGALMEGGHS